MSQSTHVKWYGKKVSSSLTRSAQHGLYLWGEHVLEEAVRIVPVAPSGGTLERSGKAHAPTGDELRAAVSFDTPYAVKQHEELDYQHSRPGAQAKYLETAVNEGQQRAQWLLTHEIKKELGTVGQ